MDDQMHRDPQLGGWSPLFTGIGIDHMSGAAHIDALGISARVLGARLFYVAGIDPVGT